MVIINELPQIRVSIRMAGSERDCVEYDDPDPPLIPPVSGEAMYSTSKIIESHDDTQYYIYFEVDNRSGWIKEPVGIGLVAYIDGKIVARPVYWQQSLVGQVLRTRLDEAYGLSGKPGKAIARTFKFSAISSVNGRLDYLDQDRRAAEHLGEIEVAIRRVGYLGKGKACSYALDSPTELGEKALKGKNVSHGTEFTGGKEVEALQRFYLMNLDGDKNLARMTFRYMSKSALQIGGIIPRDPSPPTVRYSFEDLNLVQIGRLIERLEMFKRKVQERLDKLKKLAQERLEENKDARRVKRVASSDVDPRARKVYKADVDGIIDLAED